MQDIIYTLELNEGKYYVGRTNNLDRRILEHSTKTNKWVTTYGIVRVLNSKIMMGMFDEDTTTKELMVKYGIDNVRGGTYTTFTLSSNHRKLLEKELLHANDGCFVCGSTEHYADKCTSVKLETTVKPKKSDFPKFPKIIEDYKVIKPVPTKGAYLDFKDQKTLPVSIDTQTTPKSKLISSKLISSKLMSSTLIQSICVTCKLTPTTNPKFEQCLQCWKFDNGLLVCNHCHSKPVNRVDQSLCLQCWKFESGKLKCTKCKKNKVSDALHTLCLDCWKIDNKK